MRTYTAVVTANGRDGRAVSADGTLDLALALPKEMGGDGAGTNPEQLFAAGYAACFTSAMRFAAARKGMDASGASVTAEVGLSGNGRGGFQLDAVLRVHLPETIPAEARQDLVEATHQVCPYSNATRGNIPVELILD
jgi:Ohr subfamily peroxiredoxin